MLTLTDCLDLCELNRDEVDAIGEHEHLPDILASELGAYLMRTNDGPITIAHMIADDIAEATRKGDVEHAAKLKITLRHFCEAHFEAAKLN